MPVLLLVFFSLLLRGIFPITALPRLRTDMCFRSGCSPVASSSSRLHPGQWPALLGHAHEEAASLDGPELEFPPGEPTLHVCTCVYRAKSTCVKRQRPSLGGEKRSPPTGVHKVKPMSVRILGGTIKERYLSQRFLLIYSWGWVVERKTRDFLYIRAVVREKTKTKKEANTESSFIY